MLFSPLSSLISGALALATPITDPHSVLEQLDDRLGRRSFGEALHCDDSVEVRHYRENCVYRLCSSRTGCVSRCEPSQRRERSWISSCRPDSVQVVRDDGTVIEHSLDSWTAARGNLLRDRLQEVALTLNQPGELRIDPLTETTYRLEDGRSLSALRISGGFLVEDHPPSGTPPLTGPERPVPWHYIVATEGTALGQILELSLNSQRLFSVSRMSR